MSTAHIFKIIVFLSIFPICVLAENKVFHFLPPSFPEWSSGGIELVIQDQSRTYLLMDPDHCGWWYTILPESLKGKKAFLEVKQDSVVHRMGMLGMQFEEPKPILFDSITSANPYSSHLYFAPSRRVQAWTTTWQDFKLSCYMPLFHFVNDSDPLLNSGFYASDAKSALCRGVTKNMVQPQLNKDGKPQYNPVSGCFQNDSVFQRLFHAGGFSTETTCITTSLTTTKQSDWLYDSRVSISGGLFLPSSKDYTASTPREAYSSVSLGVGTGSHQSNHLNSEAIASGLFPDGLNWGMNMATPPFSPLFQYPTQDGEFADSTHPNVYDIDSWSKRTKSMQNLSFCMESQINFYFQPGQYFSFLGDDDFWLFIDSTLVLDLGGLHLPAPGMLLLDSLSGLLPGTMHSLQTFHCNRKSSMSTYVIRTNIQKAQNSGVTMYYERDLDKIKFQHFIHTDRICSLSDNPSMMTNEPFVDLRHAILNLEGDSIDADPSTKEFDAYIPEDKVVWGGIKVSGDYLWIDSLNLNLPPGRYNLYVETIGPTASMFLYLRARDPSSIKASSPNRRTNESIQTNTKYTVRGQLIPQDKAYRGIVIPRDGLPDQKVSPQ